MPENLRLIFVGDVSLRLGHATALICHRHIIHYRVAASLPGRSVLSIMYISRAGVYLPPFKNAEQMKCRADEVQSAECRMQSGGWRVESGEWRVESGECRMQS